MKHEKQPVQQPEPLLRLEEVASRLNISYPQIWRIINAGTIRSIRIGPKSIRVRESDLEKYIKEKTNER